METTKDFKVGDTVIFIPNGLEFKCLDLKMWKRMQDSGNYIKTLSPEKKFTQSEKKALDL